MFTDGLTTIRPVVEDFTEENMSIVERDDFDSSTFFDDYDRRLSQGLPAPATSTEIARPTIPTYIRPAARAFGDYSVEG